MINKVITRILLKFHLFILGFQLGMMIKKVTTRIPRMLRFSWSKRIPYCVPKLFDYNFSFYSHLEISQLFRLWKVKTIQKLIFYGINGINVQIIRRHVPMRFDPIFLDASRCVIMQWRKCNCTLLLITPSHSVENTEFFCQSDFFT